MCLVLSVSYNNGFLSRKEELKFGYPRFCRHVIFSCYNWRVRIDSGYQHNTWYSKQYLT